MQYSKKLSYKKMESVQKLLFTLSLHKKIR
jgi:hypothetical protein